LAAVTQASTITVVAQDTALDTEEVTTPGVIEGDIRDEDIRRHLAATIRPVLVLPTLEDPIECMCEDERLLDPRQRSPALQSSNSYKWLLLFGGHT
jgi:hypothetical protein